MVRSAPVQQIRSERIRSPRKGSPRTEKGTAHEHGKGGATVAADRRKGQPESRDDPSSLAGFCGTKSGEAFFWTGQCDMGQLSVS
jgi:hypothetical protein